jgi:hypothetical protein
MEIRKLSNGYQFVNNSRGNRSGFVHETTLFNNNGLEVGNYKIQYYNRTWECYQFQTVMKNCISKIIEEKKDNFIRLAKEKYNIKRLTKEKREQAEQVFEEMEQIKELRKMYKELDNRA